MFGGPSAYPKPPYCTYEGLSRYEQLLRHYEDVRESGIPHEKKNLPYYFVFDWELNWDRFEDAHVWIMDHWTLSFYIAAFYLVLVFFGRRWMQSRPPSDLKKRLIIWNLVNSAFSIICFFRLLPEVIDVVHRNSLYYTLCFGK